VIYPADIIDRLQEVEAVGWVGVVFRYMLAGLPPDRENSRGARWNPPETRAIYVSLDRETMLAEANFYIGQQPRAPKVKRTLYRIGVELSSVIDLSEWARLSAFGIDRKSFASVGYEQFQMIGGSAEWLGHDGLLVPSARSNGTNLVIYPNRQTSSYKFTVLDDEEL
jgi:RES domain-containing protein